jgi:hypothetical protein
MVAVPKEQSPEVNPEVIQAGVGDRALGQVADDRAVPGLLGRLDFDGIRR